MSSFFKDGLSLDETRVSLVMLTFLVTVIFSLWEYHNTKILDDNLLTLIAYQLVAITGMNIADKFSLLNKASKKNNNVGD